MFLNLSPGASVPARWDPRPIQQPCCCPEATSAPLALLAVTKDIQRHLVVQEQHTPEVFAGEGMLATHAHTSSLVTSPTARTGSPQNCAAGCCTGAQGCCSCTGNHSAPGSRNSTTEEPRHIYGEHGVFLQRCIPGKPSST